MASGNKGFADLVSGGMARPPARLPPRTGILGARENRLAEIASGAAVARMHEAVDPARCRIWDGHNRDYAALSETLCADLIESFRAQGRQEVPAIVRRVTNDPAHEFEVICGARRHWTVSWLRANTYPDFKFLVEPRELTDEEAFRLADLENRSRKDLSDYERATDYARAIERYYGGSQQKMVERLDVSKSWLSRYLELARLPEAVVRSFASPHQIGISHAAALAPLLRAPKTRALVMAEAEQWAGQGATPAAVVRRLVAAASGKPAKRRAKEVEVKDAAGKLVAQALQSPAGTLSITVPGYAGWDRTQLLAALDELLDKIGR
jgi:ParB family chromosome partitioning protein